MTPQQERLAEALAIRRMHGASGPRWIAERLLALMEAGDYVGAERFTAIAAEYEKLLGGTVQ
jgi:hypothetical protein